MDRAETYGKMYMKRKLEKVNQQLEKYHKRLPVIFLMEVFLTS